MTIYAVQYFYPDDMTEMLKHRPEHREFIRNCPGLLIGGAFKDEVSVLDTHGEAEEPPNGGIMALEAESIEALAELLDGDPYLTRGFLVRRIIREWDPPLGPWATRD